jgi:predicted metalloprotease
MLGLDALQKMNDIEDGDLDEALSAAHAVGDDAINLKCKAHCT